MHNSSKEVEQDECRVEHDSLSAIALTKGRESWIMYQDYKCSPSTSRINFERLQAPCANGWVCEVQSKRSSLLLHEISEMTGLVE